VRRCALALALVAGVGPAAAELPAGPVDTALVLAVDVSGSVDGERYRLQMEGIAAAFEDAAVQRAILSGPREAMLITLVQWSDKPRLAIPWTRIARRADAEAFAARVRALPRQAAEFTCMAEMLRFVYDKVLPRTPGPASRSVVDVSGDGRDNCNTDRVGGLRDALVATDVTINGLPILEGREAAGLAEWYREEVIGGAGAFLLPAEGFADFARAIRQKFITEISWIAPTTFE
jgi:hypothetical protein